MEIYFAYLTDVQSQLRHFRPWSSSLGRTEKKGEIIWSLCLIPLAGVCVCVWLTWSSQLDHTAHKESARMHQHIIIGIKIYIKNLRSTQRPGPIRDLLRCYRPDLFKYFIKQQEFKFKQEEERWVLPARTHSDSDDGGAMADHRPGRQMTPLQPENKVRGTVSTDGRVPHRSVTHSGFRCAALSGSLRRAQTHVQVRVKTHALILEVS